MAQAERHRAEGARCPDRPRSDEPPGSGRTRLRTRTWHLPAWSCGLPEQRRGRRRSAAMPSTSPRRLARRTRPARRQSRGSASHSARRPCRSQRADAMRQRWVGSDRRLAGRSPWHPSGSARPSSVRDRSAVDSCGQLVDRIADAGPHGQVRAVRRVEGPAQVHRTAAGRERSIPGGERSPAAPSGGTTASSRRCSAAPPERMNGVHFVVTAPGFPAA